MAPSASSGEHSFTNIPESWLRGLLSVPFLIVIAVERGLTRGIAAIQGADETNYHYPVIRKFGRELPHVHLHNYLSATTPLFQLTFAVLGRVVGFQLWRLRLLEALLSYLLVVATYELLRRDVHLDRMRSFVLAAMFGISPYVFAESFRLLTDNMAALFTVLALHCLFSFRRTQRWKCFAGFAVTAGLAVLTRQLFVWLFPVGGVLMLVGPWSLRSKIRGSAFIAACAAPLVALFVSWHGVVPPSWRYVSRATSPDARGALFAIAVLGVYSLLINSSEWLRLLRLDRVRKGELGHLAIPGALAVVGLAIVVIRPIGSTPGDFGWLWRVSHALPHDIALVALVPVGCAALYLFGRPPRGRILLPLVGLFLVVSAANAQAYQVYSEPAAILFCLLAIDPAPIGARDGVPAAPAARSALRYGGPMLVIVGSLAYLGTAR
jgi:4-amino-4-deoxy-L-arabinose transferase-like glycosyltransferase